MFGVVAPRYDLLNHLLSVNRDRSWRRAAVDRLLMGGPAGGHYLDACAGTFDLSVELAGRPNFAGRVAACDFSWPMLTRGRPKVAAESTIAPVCGDALRLPFADVTFNGAIVGFGVRNLEDVDAGLRELARVLVPGARLVVLEFAIPRWRPLRAAYLVYFRHILPRVGQFISRDKDAYSYLPESVLAFPGPAELAEKMRAAGFRDVGWRRRTAGIVAIHSGERV